MQGIYSRRLAIFLLGLLGASGLTVLRGADLASSQRVPDADPARAAGAAEKGPDQKPSERAQRVLEQIRQLNESEVELIVREVAGRARALPHARLAEAHRDLSRLHERLAEALNRRPVNEADVRKLEEEIRGVVRNRVRRSEQALRRAERAMRLAEGRMRLFENRMREWEGRWQDVPTPPHPPAPPAPPPREKN